MRSVLPFILLSFSSAQDSVPSGGQFNITVGIPELFFEDPSNTTETPTQSPAEWPTFVLTIPMAPPPNVTNNNTTSTSFTTPPTDPAPSPAIGTAPTPKPVTLVFGGVVVNNPTPVVATTSAPEIMVVVETPEGRSSPPIMTNTNETMTEPSTTNETMTNDTPLTNETMTPNMTEPELNVTDTLITPRTNTTTSDTNATTSAVPFPSNTSTTGAPTLSPTGDVFTNTSTTSMDPMCEAHNSCSTLAGACCPTAPPDAVFLSCCGMGEVQPTCTENPQCAALDLEGACCPTPSSNTYLDCCSVVPDACGSDEDSSCVVISALDYKRELETKATPEDDSSSMGATTMSLLMLVPFSVAAVAMF